MNKRLLFIPAGLCFLSFLASCASEYETTLYIQNGDVRLQYQISSELKEGSALKGSLFIDKEDSLKDSYVLAYTFDEPKMSTTNYSETTLYTFNKENILGKTSVKYLVTLNLSEVFPKDSQTSKVYIVIRTSDYDFTDVYSYGSSCLTYSWSGDTVKLS